MTAADLRFSPDGDMVRFQLHDGDAPIPCDAWSIRAPDALIPAIDLLKRLVAEDGALEDGQGIVLQADAVADLSARDAALLGLPGLADAQLNLRLDGLITQPTCQVRAEWQRPTGQPIIAPTRQGALLKVGDTWRRLPRSLLDIAEAADRHAKVGPMEKLSALAALTEKLPAAAAENLARAQGALTTIKLLEADAFSLDFDGDAADPILVPVLHRAGGTEDDAEPLLPPDMQQEFGRRQFQNFAEARGLYSPAPNTFLVIAPALRQALQVVRSARAAPAAWRRALLRNPRAELAAALGQGMDETVLQRVFRDTPEYAERVRGLGLWTPRILPWIALPSSDWFGPETGGEATPRAEPHGGLTVGDQRITLSPPEAETLAAEIESAISKGEPAVPLRRGERIISVPALPETLGALAKLAQARTTRKTAPEATPGAPEVLLIAPNTDALDIEAFCTPRPAHTAPPMLATVLKPHQQQGLDWLIESWKGGDPGVLLADEMGLGKTLQALAFLAWLRAGMAGGAIPRAPLLIVAPTGLLENWRAEHARHLASPGLGTCLGAYGGGLVALRVTDPDGAAGLNVARIAAADWVLTTYETLRDHDRHFGQVRFAAAVFDEAQKIKSPAARMTDAAKAMNVDFRVAITGTPVENRLADLWCIVDGLHPGYLDDLRGFSARYEAPGDAARMIELKAMLDRPRGGRPPLLLRRLKQDRLPDLPEITEQPVERAMPAQQLDAYRTAIEGARQAKRRGAVLDALRAMRRVSLCAHDPSETASDQALITSSARLSLGIDILDSLAARGEAALIFLDDLGMMARLAGLIQRRFQLAAEPMMINGSVAGTQRQARVDRFQAHHSGFDVMLLSPRAAGVGLTLTRASHVIHLARWWNPAVEDQCNARAHRIGQTRPVTVHLPMAVLPQHGQSFDQTLHALLARKRELMRNALEPPAESAADREELLERTLNGLDA